MKKKVISIIFISFLVAGIFVSVANFSIGLFANEGGPEEIWGMWALNHFCDLGWECIESTTIDCFSDNPGCK